MCFFKLANDESEQAIAIPDTISPTQNVSDDKSKEPAETAINEKKTRSSKRRAKAMSQNVEEIEQLPKKKR